MRTVAVTGHRPDKLGGYSDSARNRLVAFATETLRKYRPDRLIDGMAQGGDQAFAEAAIALGIPFDAYIPFVGQDYVWPDESRERYRAILAKAANVVTVCDPPFKAWKLLRRNEAMVNALSAYSDGALLALWNGSGGGTAHCWNYAGKAGVQRVNLWNEWQRFGRPVIKVTREFTEDHWVKRFVDEIHARNSK